jgi:hypothetical protein
LLIAAGRFAKLERQNIFAPMILLLACLGGGGAIRSLYMHYYWQPTNDAPLAWVKLPVQESTPLVPITLGQGGKASGKLSLPHASQIKNVGVFISNHRNKSNGFLHLRLCNDLGCSDAHRHLKKSKNNRYLYFRFERPLKVNAGGVNHYEFWLSDSTHPVSLMTKAAEPSGPSLNLGDPPAQTQSSPLFIIIHQTES